MQPIVGAVEADIDLTQFEQLIDEDDGQKNRILILFGSETGTAAEGFARKAARQLNAYHPKVMALDDCNTHQIADEKLLLVVTSTFGNGEIPGNGQQFMSWLKQQPAGSLEGLNYSV